LLDDLAWGGYFCEDLFTAAAATAFLFENRLAQIDALAADVDVAGAFHQGSNVAVALSAEGAEGVFFGGSAASAP